MVEARIFMNNFSFKVFGCFILLFFVFSFFAIDFVYAGYQKIAPGDTVTLGEFVYDDDFVATTTAGCVLSIFDPDENLVFNGAMTASSTGWTYHNYVVPSAGPSGIWPTQMTCGSVLNGDLVKVDKSFTVDWSVVSTSTIKGVVDESLTVATSSLAAVINAHTDTQAAGIVSAVNLVTESASSSLAAGLQTASSSIVSQILSSITSIPALVWTYLSDVNNRLITAIWGNATTRTLTGAGLDSGSLATLSDVQTATSSLASAITTGTSAVNTNTDAQILTASTSLANFINNNSNATILAASTSLASYLSAYTDAASSSIASFVNANTNSTILAASTSLASFINAHTDTQAAGIVSAVNLVTESASSSLATEIAKGYTVTLSDFGGTTINTAYKAKLQVLNYAAIPTDADDEPTVTITDSAGTVQVPPGVPDEMTRVSAGTYSYSYSIESGVGGVWETVVSVIINGETVRVNDYWSLSSSPADVQIIEITDKVIPTITASVRIDNKGTLPSDFYYVYCIVSSEANLCGGNDDIASGSDTKYINAGGFIDPSLTLGGVPTAGTYWFKVKARALAETNWAASTKQFTAEVESAPSCGNGSCSGGETCSSCPADCGQCSGGGGGGGGGASVIPPTVPVDSYNVADFNRDGKVNSVDFSILLAFWQKQPPFKNPYVDINKDNQVNSVDFSILLYNWGKPKN